MAPDSSYSYTTVNRGKFSSVDVVDVTFPRRFGKGADAGTDVRLGVVADVDSDVRAEGGTDVGAGIVVIVDWLVIVPSSRTGSEAALTMRRGTA